MQRRRTVMRPIVALLAAATLAVTGCRSDDSAEDGDDATVDGSAADEDGQDAGDDGADGADGAVDGPTTDADDGGGGQASPTGVIEVGETQTHPNGVELTLHRVRVERDAVFVDIEAFNPMTSTVYLAGIENALVTDDSGRSFTYRPPEDNSGLAIESGGTLEGSVAFLGRASPSATSLNVLFNHRVDTAEPLGPADDPNAANMDAPSFAFDLPLPSS